MKKIFDWLREQIGTKKGDAETRMYRLIDEDRGDRCVYSETDVEEFSANTLEDVLSILDEAEAKWEAEYNSCKGCVREDDENSFICNACSRLHGDEYEPIKISEVE